MPRRPFDWEADDEDYGADDLSYARQSPWDRRGSNEPIPRGEFYALWDGLVKDLKRLTRRVQDNEERLMEVRARHMVGDLLSSAWSRGVVIVMAILTAFVLTDLVNVKWPPW